MSNCKNYVRPLNGIPLAYQFLVNVLNITDDSLKDYSLSSDKLAIKLFCAEKLINDLNGGVTISDPSLRSPRYSKESDRKILRKVIFEELICQTRLENDDLISLGVGGAKPKVEARSDKQAYFITGLPASGKSTIVNELADTLGAYVLDSDYAKRKLPEFDVDCGASLTHDESQLIMFGKSGSQFADELNVRDYCIAKGFNMVIPKIGYDHRSLEEERNMLIDKGYGVHLTLVSLDRQKATIRAVHRFLQTSRYVPLSLIFDCYANDPVLSYYRSRECTKWSSSGKISTDVSKGEKPRLVEASSDSNPAKMYS